MENLLLDKLNYWIFIALMMLGLWAMISKKNLIKKVIGMSIFQSAVILFYVSIGAKQSGADIPIYPHDLIHPSSATAAHIPEVAAEDGLTHKHDSVGETPPTTIAESDAAHGSAATQAVGAKSAHENSHESHPKIASKVNPDDFDNPIPHVLMLTAIVVGVATLGVALALIQRIFRLYGSIEEDEVIQAIAREPSDAFTIESSPFVQTEKKSSHA